ncbi:c-type cytochrome [Pseudogemmobacter faecipullorum]|uniref:Cytochrome C n=1 Tax=Pseudogemmobacter faecipullorum TaxID=2755041 RepID=A0ABS8CGA5_9RHOB|nr:c-type cytochrome [Pseudogemmobacter faecipullorum]MCB5408421.1 cytochrome C [Pseudogemmobacter faecipullorum]
MRRALVMILPLALAACVEEPKPAGSEDFATFCSACHGAAGAGNGLAAAGLAKEPADLTRLSARNGGTFPGTAVMGKIWGYTGGRDSHAVMPEFAELLQSDLVPYDGGDGIYTPTPLRLVQIAEHLKSLQR